MNKDNNIQNPNKSSTVTSWSSRPTSNDVNNVGASTTNKVISWGVGKSKTPENEQIERLFDDDMLKDVNSVVAETEVLDESFLEPKPSLGDSLLNKQKTNLMPEILDPNGDWASNQPLSSNKLGVNSIDSNNKTNDVQKKGKFFTPFTKKKEKEPTPQPIIPVKKDLGLEEPTPNINEIELLSNFVRHDFTKINMSVFSFSAFILKGIYLINKKIYMIGLLSLAIEFYILTSLPYKTSIIAYLVWSILLALIANPLYLKYAKLKIKSIRNTKKNRKKNQYELNELCSKKGGINFLLAFLTLAIFYPGLIYLSMYEIPTSTIRQSYDYITSFIEEKKKPVYDGVIDRLSYNVDDELNITIPEEFKKETGKIYKYIYTKEGKSEAQSCSLTISLISRFKDPKGYLEQFKKYENIEQDISEKSNNDLTWYQLDQEKRSFIKKLNATNINGNVILFEYNSGKEVSNLTCQNYYDTIFNSISLKN